MLLVRRAAVFGALAAVVVTVSACVPAEPDGSADVVESPAKGLEAVVAEQILDATPAGVTPDGSQEDAADGGVVRFNAATRTFAATSEAAAEGAAEHLRSEALADGWAGGGFEDPFGVGGVPTATLTKGSLVLDISFTTEAYQQNWPSDDDGFEVRVVLTDEPTTSEIPVDGLS